MRRMLRFPDRIPFGGTLLLVGFFGLLAGWLAARAGGFFDPGLSVLLAAGALVSFCFSIGRLGVRARALRRLRKAKGASVPALPGNTSTVLVELNEVWQPGLLIERSISGLCIVYVPATLQPLTGAVYVVPAHKLQPLDMPLPELTAALERFGKGMSSRMTTPLQTG